MDRALVSIIIPVYNAEAFLPRCLDSVLAQTWRELEIILVDDGSADQSAAICREYRQRDARILVLEQENRGVSAARNAGLARAGGDYVTFLDADDWLEPEHIDLLVRSLEDHGADCAVCGYIMEWPAGPEGRGVTFSGVLTGAQALEKMLAPELFQGFLWNKLFRLDKVLEWALRMPEDLTHYEDVVFCAGYFARCNAVRVEGKTTYHYRQHGASAIGHRKADARWLRGRMSALRALERVESLCTLPNAAAMCRARAAAERADLLRRTLVWGVRAEGLPTVAEVRKDLGTVLRSPLHRKFKIKYLSTALFPTWAARFWSAREDRGLTAGSK